MRYVIETHNLTKRYRGTHTTALNKLNLCVKAGEIFGYLGPNGSGKTTTIRLLLNLIRPTQGSASIFGLDTRRQSIAIKRRLGSLPAEVDLWRRMTGEQVLRYLGALRPGCDLAYAFQLAERLHLNTGLRIAEYSTGNKRKVGIIQALMHRPELVILDEPTNGLDPLMRQILMEILNEVRAEGRTVFFSSHVLGEVQNICDRVAILRAGQLMAVEDVTALRHAQGRLIRIYTPDAVDLSEWQGFAAVEEVKAIPKGVQLRVIGDIDPIIKRAARYHVEDLVIEEPDLEEVFLKYYDHRI